MTTYIGKLEQFLEQISNKSTSKNTAGEILAEVILYLAEQPYPNTPQGHAEVSSLLCLIGLEYQDNHLLYTRILIDNGFYCPQWKKGNGSWVYCIDNGSIIPCLFEDTAYRHLKEKYSLYTYTGVVTDAMDN